MSSKSEESGSELVGFVTVDEDMDLDALKITLEKDGKQVDIWMATNPWPGRYELSREASR